MAESSSDQNQTSRSSSNPPPKSAKKPIEEEDSESDSDFEKPPSTKRRRSCGPTNQQKLPELLSSNPSLSFSFDTKLSPSVSEFTPKFGSFGNHAESASSTTYKEEDKQEARQIEEGKESNARNLSVVIVSASSLVKD